MRSKEEKLKELYDALEEIERGVSSPPKNRYVDSLRRRLLGENSIKESFHVGFTSKTEPEVKVYGGVVEEKEEEDEPLFEIEKLTASGEDDLQKPEEGNPNEGNEVGKELDEWTSYEERSIDEKLPEWKVIKEGYTYEDYTLYKVEKRGLFGRKKTVYVFSKEPPENGVPSQIPPGYVVKVNKKGVPSLEKVK